MAAARAGVKDNSDYMPVTMREIRVEWEIRLPPRGNDTFRLLDALAAGDNHKRFGRELVSVYDDALKQRRFGKPPAFLPP